MRSTWESRRKLLPSGLIHHAIVASLFLGLAACNYRRDKLGEFAGPLTTNWFQGLQAKIFERQCTGCHHPGKLSGNVDLTTYASVMGSGAIVPFRPEESRLYRSLRATPPRRMPKNSEPLAEADIALIYRWIEVGAPEREAAGAANPQDVPKPTWAWASANVFNRRCAGCHGAEDPSGGVNVTAYESLLKSSGVDTTPIVKGKPDESGVCVLMRNGKMPADDPPVLPALPKEHIEAVCRWIENGALNN